MKVEMIRPQVRDALGVTCRGGDELVLTPALCDPRLYVVRPVGLILCHTCLKEMVESSLLAMYGASVAVSFRHSEGGKGPGAAVDIEAAEDWKVTVEGPLGEGFATQVYTLTHASLKVRLGRVLALRGLIKEGTITSTPLAGPPPRTEG